MADQDECSLCGSIEWSPVEGESGMRQCGNCGNRWHKSWGEGTGIAPMFVDDECPDE